MTRINLVDPSVLTDKHLMAEYRELPRIFTAVKKLLYTPQPRIGDAWAKFIESNQIPEKYVLGKGHMKFFYNKLPWLRERYRSIAYQLRYERKFETDLQLVKDILSEADHMIASTRLDMIETWRPSPEEIYLNMARICKRSNIDKVLDELSAD